jgi:hypothetical protein
MAVLSAAPDTDADTDTIIDAPDFLQSCVEAYEEYREHGNVEREMAEAQIGWGLGLYQRRTSMWRFVDDACDGTGIFSNGQALWPHPLEIENGVESAKFRSRRAMAVYANWCSTVQNAAFDSIVASKDLIQRKSDDARLTDFWADCDRRGQTTIEFLEFAQQQCRRFGSAFIFVDRPMTNLTNQAADLSPDNRVYCYAIATEAVRYWHFDDFGVLDAIIYSAPDPTQPYPDESSEPPLRIWTRDAWCDIVTTGGTGAYQFLRGGPNPLGEIPCVILSNQTPGPGKALGYTEMLSVCKAAQAVYNIDSQIQEIQRKCAVIMVMPVKDATGYTEKEIVYGSENTLLYDGSAGAPAWLSPDLTVCDKLQATRKAIIDDAFQSANLTGLVGSREILQATSGFHAEIAIAQTEKRLARSAAALENAEMQMSRLVLRYYGVPSAAITGKFQVDYPRDFGIRDLDTAMTRAERVFAIDLGDGVNRVELGSLIRILYPRMPQAQLNQLADEGVKALRGPKEIAANQKILQAAGSRVQGTNIRDLLSGKLTG